jgi:hypothetical protein
MRLHEGPFRSPLFVPYNGAGAWLAVFLLSAGFVCSCLSGVSVSKRRPNRGRPVFGSRAKLHAGWTPTHQTGPHRASPATTAMPRSVATRPALSPNSSR